MKRRRMKPGDTPPDALRGIDDELRFHIEGRIESLMAEGMEEAEARRRALAAFGDVERVRAEMQRIEAARVERDSRRWRLESVWTDVRLGARRLVRTPVASLAAIVTLAVGIGAAVAVFSVLDAVVLRPLPYARPDELFELMPGRTRSMNIAMSRALSEAMPSVEAYTGISRWQLTLTGEGEARTVAAEVVDAGYFDVFAVRPVLGRPLLPSDTDPAAPGVVLLSHGLWRTVFGADPGVLGRSLELEGYTKSRLEVVGVMPAGFRAVGAEADGRPMEAADVWVPLQLAPGRSPAADSSWFVSQLIARVKPGASAAQVAQEARRAAEALREQYPFLMSEDELRAAGAVRLIDGIVGGVRGTLWTLLGAVGLVLLIACANLANLQLARAAGRQPDFALRLALGASRGRLVREQLAESAVLALTGGALAILVASALLDALNVARSYGLPRVESVSVDVRACAFALGVTVLCALLFGLVPALRAAGAAPGPHIQRAGRTASAGTSHFLSRALVAAEMAFSVVLVSAAGLVLTSFLSIRSVDPGLDVADVSVVRVWPPAQRYDGDPAIQFYRGLEERLRALPGVTAAGAIQLEPFTGGNWSFPFLPEGHTPAEGEPLPSANFRVVTPGYFDAVDMRLIAGRQFDAGDVGGGTGAIILNESLARTLWPDADPLGREVRIFGDIPFRVVGIVGDVHQHALDRAPSPEMYVPHAQWDLVSMAVMVEGLAAGALARAIRAAVTEAGPDIALSDVRPMADLLHESLARRRFFTLLVGGFGVIALILGGVGIYGVTAHFVGGLLPAASVRMALGATPGKVVRHTMTRALAPVAVGLVAGLAGAAAATGLMRGFVFGAATLDLPLYLAVGLGLAAVAAVATWLPARRLARLDPLALLRAD